MCALQFSKAQILCIIIKILEYNTLQEVLIGFFYLNEHSNVDLASKAHNKSVKCSTYVLKMLIKIAGCCSLRGRGI